MEAERVGALRVWLEPGYDNGRFGVWLLDWPGAFCSGAEPQPALARAHSTAWRFVEWLAEHGERGRDLVPPAPTAVPEVVEEVPAQRLDDGYEVNATFGWDRRPATSDEVERQVQRLGYAREDLLGVVRRVRDFEAGGGELTAGNGASADRTVDEVLRHVAGAEAWFVSRLEEGARYAGAPRDGELAPYLEETRAWLVDALRRFVARDPALSRVDGKGEEWTLAKLLRRALYHSLDHLEELDRRLAIAENRVGRVEIRLGGDVDIEELLTLFDGAGLRARARLGAERVARMLAGSTQTVTAWDGQRLVGFARIISDEVTNGYIGTVAVAPRWQDRGLGTRLMRALMDGRDELKLTLDARAGSERFYERLGFERAQSIYVRPRPS